MPENLTAVDLQLTSPNEALALFGNNDKHLHQLEEMLQVSIVTRGEQVHVSGNPDTIDLVQDVLQALLSVIRKGLTITERDVVYAVELGKKGKINQFETLFEDEITKNVKGKPIRVKTLGQKKYISAIKANDLVFGIGPAGTGKTYLAVVMAVHALKNGYVKRIILTRPAVEAGESLGFLPGDLKEKVDPYLRPLYDALHDVLGTEHTMRLIERETIEIAPLAYMRGRTLDDAFVILDEAQNTTPEQMKMFLTRLGFGSKMVITGDITQIDLPKGMQSGLRVASHLLNGIKGMAFVYLEQTDVVRHPLVQRIIDAYDKNRNNSIS
ncbi:phosphate starvation protein PhoH [Virgibacillus pantothenticus]|uniref:PhoH-like protein n=1 Tax=Virgibacillus pantothenticus TaxID=1473 RepID=A0A0L0QPQ6_VIRPA|nr:MULTISPECIES: PhoH family protein [Virgibacillus]API90572.1 phosphate starvation-inducible protein PhoH [Virgibacillus sp. 6R]KNE20526.1 phosphate starvation protein PhoH [Virgibacillus pantothenticus]MBS7429685.1 PhoH family protein [Virgibacillus sp. 19R1-5]MBU8565560.1 PhoH family protein [Virgibacillus pantothenticus]MBU8599858.1 PhoH family protein [Virgibacillus pantothenticus]